MKMTGVGSIAFKGWGQHQTPFGFIPVWFFSPFTVMPGTNGLGALMKMEWMVIYEVRLKVLKHVFCPSLPSSCLLSG
jgi:hypothetical protein